MGDPLGAPLYCPLFSWHGPVHPPCGTAGKLRTKPESEQKALRDPTCGVTCPGPPTCPRLGGCSVLTSPSCPAWLPNTDHRDGVLFCPASGSWESILCRYEASTLCPNNSPEAHKPEVNKLLNPLLGLQDPPQGPPLSALGSNSLSPPLHGAWTPGRTRDSPVSHFKASPLSRGSQSL